MDYYIALILFCISTSITPGPNNLTLLISGLNNGIRKSLPAFLGIAVGFVFMLVIMGLGLGSVFILYPKLHLLVKVCGSVYMLYMAFKIINSSTSIQTGDAPKALKFYQTFIYQWVNPKAFLMSISVFATFTLVNQPIVSQVFLITLVYFLVLLPCILVWLLGGAYLKSILKHERQVKFFNIIMGIMLVLSILLIWK